LWKNSSRRKISFKDTGEILRKKLGYDIYGIIVFGSYIYMGGGNDIDILVVTSGVFDVKGRVKLEEMLSRELREHYKNVFFDVHIMDLETFKKNLVPGTFLSGLALGYETIYDRGGIEEMILDFLEKLSKDRYILHNKYGSWNLSQMAKITYRRKKKLIK